MWHQLILPLALLAGMIGQVASAGCADDCCAKACSGEKACLLTPEVVQEEKHCWCTESKEICIPQVVCPWKKGGSGLTLFSWLHAGKKKPTDCCDATGCPGDCSVPCECALPRRGKIKRVCDLKKEKYEVDVCQWKQDPDACGTGCCCDSGPCCGCIEPSCAQPSCGLQICDGVGGN